MSHYYSEKQESPLNLSTITVKINNEYLEFYTGSGVFSKGKLDKGTELMLKNVENCENKTVLDLGCGIGVVGVYIKYKFPSTEITMTDVNARAAMLARKNLARYNMKGKVMQSDGLAKLKDKFDYIYLNPPQVAGKQTCIRLIKESHEHLNKDGALIVVARHNKGGKTLSLEMEKLFGNMTEVDKGSGFRIYKSTR